MTDINEIKNHIRKYHEKNFQEKLLSDLMRFLREEQKVLKKLKNA